MVMLRRLAIVSVAVGAAVIAGFTTTTNASPTTELELAARAVASPDSYPVLAIRDELGRKNFTLKAGESIQMCALARNVYTNRVMILIPQGITPSQADTVATKCEVARQRYTEELTPPSQA